MAVDSAFAPSAVSSSEPSASPAEFGNYPAHPLAEIFPMMAEPQLQELATDIKENGLQQEIVLYQGKVVDGRNRQAACRLAEVPPKYKEWSSKLSLVTWILSHNLHRRHLTDLQRALVAAKAKDAMEAEALERRNANLVQNREAAAEVDGESAEMGRSAEKAAAILNVSVDATKKAARVLKAGAANLVEAVEKGTVSLDAASLLATLPKEEQQAAVAEGRVKQTAKALRDAKKKAKDPSKSKGRKKDVAAEEPASTASAAPVAQPLTPAQAAAAFKEAFALVLGAVRDQGPDLARHLAVQLATETGLDLWVRSDDEKDNSATLARLMLAHLEVLAGQNYDEARTLVEEHLAQLTQVLQAARPQGVTQSLNL